MKIIDILNRSTPTFSFEFFPPKDENGAEALLQTIKELSPLAPSYVSVTYGAGGSTRRRTVDLVKMIKNDIGLETMAHLTCVGATREEIAGVLDELQAAGVENILALRGDPPRGETEFKPVDGGFPHASELAEFIRSRYDFCIGGACYPEKHPEAPSMQEDLLHLKKKVESGAQFLVSQLFFDNADFLRFRDRLHAMGINVPLIAGIMPILSTSQTKRFTNLCGATIPCALLERLEVAGEDEAEVRRIGVEHALEQCQGLMAEGVAGIHFYTLNRSRATREIWQQLQAR